MSIDTLIALGGFITGALSLFISLRREFKQQDQDKINKYVRERMEKEQVPRVELDCEIYSNTLLRSGKSVKEYYLNVANSGNVGARNVNVLFEDSMNGRIGSDASILPFDILEPQHHFDMLIVPFMETPRKFKVQLLWETEDGKQESVEKLVSW